MPRKEKNSNVTFGVGYAPHMFGSGPNSWYTHRLGIRLEYSGQTNEADYPFDRIPFNLNNDLLKHRDSNAYRQRVINDVRAIHSMGIQLVRVHVFPATEENLPYLKWFASVCEDHAIKLMVDLVKERTEHWFQVDPRMCAIYAKKLRGKVAIWQIMNETNFQENPDLIISSFTESGNEIRKVDPDVLICLNNAGFDPEYTERFIGAGASFEVLGVDYYPGDNDEDYVLNQCNLLQKFHKKHPGIRIMIDELGIHPKENVKYSTSRIELHGKLFDEYLRIFLEEIGTFLFAVIPFWFQDLLVFRTQCYHQLVNLDRTLTSVGETYTRIIQEHSSNPVYLDQMPKIRRGCLRLNRNLPLIKGVNFYPSINHVGNFLEQLDSPLIVVGNDLSANFYECGMFLAKTLSYFLQQQPEVRTDIEIRSGKGRGDACIFIGNKSTNLFLQKSNINQIKESRYGTASVIHLSGKKVLVVNGADDDGAIAVTLDLVRRYWQTKNSLSPEFTFEDLHL